MTEQTIKNVSIAVALAEKDGQILILQRKDKNPMWDKKWEFPGGKIEPGESAEKALEREVLEETGLITLSSEFLGLHLHDWHLPDKIVRVELHCFKCEVGEGEVVLEENHAYECAWISPAEAIEFDLLEANADLIKKFLPEHFS